VVPLYVYKTLDSFAESMSEYVREALQDGVFGWRVTDCVVTMFESGYSVPDGPPSRRGPLSTAADFRKLTPLVLLQALEQSGTVVCEPVVRASLEVPTETVGAVVPALTRLGGTVENVSLPRELSTVTAFLPAVRAGDLQRQLPGLTRGEGVVDASFAGYRPVSGDPPRRRLASRACR
jgi:ribosomal protection tetracycline resistance protein